jgi:hypothetical protein
MGCPKNFKKSKKIKIFEPIHNTFYGLHLELILKIGQPLKWEFNGTSRPACNIVYVCCIWFSGKLSK